MFYLIDDDVEICNYADDITVLCSGVCMKDIKEKKTHLCPISWKMLNYCMALNVNVDSVYPENSFSIIK